MYTYLKKVNIYTLLILDTHIYNFIYKIKISFF